MTTSSFDISVPEADRLRERGLEFVLNPYGRRLTEEEACGLYADPEVVAVVAGVEPITRAVIDAAPGLTVISRCGTGLDNVDLTAAQERGIAVLNTPEAPAEAVAELTLGLMLAALREVPLQDQAIRNGGWERPMGGLLSARTVGLVGCGHIGRRVASLLRPFGSPLLVHDPYADAASLPDEAQPVELDRLLAEADVVSLHVPKTPETAHLMNGERLRRMKPGAILLNTARGGLVDETALAEVLRDGPLAAAALDVYEEEPYQGPLIDRPNAILTAHVGSYAREARGRQEREALRNLKDALPDG